eukprot:TRINITY_DN16915_c0_g1_i1.p1 TRINITY_DN16915_c0_g1~~TRINITY_DN16915_c0_g1_i1.p1  ORF type:complete len:615 (+),score=121.37 TRINITY_DN16915_c0_g1_i1:34-1845(+)
MAPLVRALVAAALFSAASGRPAAAGFAGASSAAARGGGFAASPGQDTAVRDAVDGIAGLMQRFQQMQPQLPRIPQAELEVVVREGQQLHDRFVELQEKMRAAEMGAAASGIEDRVITYHRDLALFVDRVEAKLGITGPVPQSFGGALPAQPQASPFGGVGSAAGGSLPPLPSAGFGRGPAGLGQQGVQANTEQRLQKTMRSVVDGMQRFEALHPRLRQTSQQLFTEIARRGQQLHEEFLALQRRGVELAGTGNTPMREADAAPYLEQLESFVARQDAFVNDAEERVRGAEAAGGAMGGGSNFGMGGLPAAGLGGVGGMPSAGLAAGGVQASSFGSAGGLPTVGGFGGAGAGIPSSNSGLTGGFASGGFGGGTPPAMQPLPPLGSGPAFGGNVGQFGGSGGGIPFGSAGAAPLGGGSFSRGASFGSAAVGGGGGSFGAPAAGAAPLGAGGMGFGGVAAGTVTPATDSRLSAAVKSVIDLMQEFERMKPQLTRLPPQVLDRIANNGQVLHERFVALQQRGTVLAGNSAMPKQMSEQDALAYATDMEAFHKDQVQFVENARQSVQGSAGAGGFPGAGGMLPSASPGGLDGGLPRAGLGSGFGGLPR